MDITQLNIPLNIIFKNDSYIILKTREAKEYVDGKATDNIIGYKYECVDTDSFEKFSVKILGNKPIISQDVIDGSADHIKVSFVNAFAKAYRTSSGRYELSFKADTMKIL